MDTLLGINIRKCREVLIYQELTSVIINSAIEVQSVLGIGFLEKVYENALIVELINKDLKVEQQKNMKVYYKGFEVGNYVADIIVENTVVLELKSVKNLDPVFNVQLLNYIKALNLELGLLINFGNPKLEVKRIINTEKTFRR